MSEHIVLLVHGIRDTGRWTHRARQLFGEEGLIGIPVQLGFYDVLSFISPMDQSRRAYGCLSTAVAAARDRYPSASISIVAHSFGTYLVGKLLEEQPTLELERVILCGSVLSADYKWENAADVFRGRGNSVLNECGTYDPWPWMSTLTGSRYGDSGKHGFRFGVAGLVIDRWFVGGHDLFFDVPHVKRAWIPFLKEGRLPDGVMPPTASLLERVFSTFKWLKSLAWLLVVILYCVLRFPLHLVGIGSLLGLVLWCVLGFEYEQENLEDCLVKMSEELKDFRIGLSSEEPGSRKESRKRWDRFSAGYSGRRVKFEAVILEVGSVIEDEEGDYRTLILSAANASMVLDEEVYRVSANVPLSQITENASMLASKSVRGNARAYRKAHIECKVNNVSTDKYMDVDVDKLQLVDDSDRWTCVLPEP